MKRKAILLLIAGCITLATTLAGLIMIIIGLGSHSGTYNATFAIGLYMFALSLIACIPCLVDAKREFKQIRSEKQSVILEAENSGDEDTELEKEEVVQTIKEIVAETIAQTTMDTGDGHKPVKYCTDCGCAIDKNSNYCKICGKEQE